MSLRFKVALILAAVAVLYGGINYGIQRLVVYPRFASLERAEAQEDIIRCGKILGREIHRLDVWARSWAALEDTRRIVTEGDGESPGGRPLDQVFAGSEVDLLILYDSRDREVLRKVRPTRERGASSGGDAPRADSSLGARILRARGESGRPVSGVVVTAGGPMLVASRAVASRAGKDASAGGSSPRPGRWDCCWPWR